MLSGVNDDVAVAKVMINGIIPRTTKATTEMEIEPPIILINEPKNIDRDVTKIYVAKKYAI